MAQDTKLSVDPHDRQVTTRRAVLGSMGVAALWLLESCGGAGDTASGQDTPGTSSLALVRSTDIGLAYANSSINISAFRQQSILAVGDGEHAVAYFDELGDARIVLLSADGSRSRAAGIDPPIEARLLADGHCSINLGLSRDGRIHFIFGAHGTLPVYGSLLVSDLRSTAGALRVRGGLWRRTITYPQFYRVGEALQLWFRSDPDNTIQFVSHDMASGTFDDEPVSVLAANGLEGPYMNQLAHLGQHLALSWVYRMPSADGLVRNEGLYVAESADGGRTWATRDAAPLALPIVRGALSTVLALQSTLQPLNQTSSCFAADGTLFVSYYARDASGTHQIHLARFGPTGSPIIEVVSDNDRRFDLTGAGTLTLPLSRPQVVTSNTHAHVIYRQSGTMVVATRERAAGSAAAWVLAKRDVGDLGAWEPTCCRETWENSGRLLVFVQAVRQGPRDTDALGDPSQARVFTFTG